MLIFDLNYILQYKEIVFRDYLKPVSWVDREQAGFCFRQPLSLNIFTYSPSLCLLNICSLLLFGSPWVWWMYCLPSSPAFPVHSRSESQMLCSAPASVPWLEALLMCIGFSLWFGVYDKWEKMRTLAARAVEEFVMGKAIQEGGLCSWDASQSHPVGIKGFLSLQRTGSEVLWRWVWWRWWEQNQSPPPPNHFGWAGRGRKSSCLWRKEKLEAVWGVGERK